MVVAEREQSVAILEKRAHALELEIERRAALERQMQHLLELTGELAGAHTRDDVLRLTVRRGLAALDAVDGALWELTPESTLAIAARTDGYAPAAAIALTQDSPLSRAVRSGDGVFVSSRAELAERFPATFEQTRALLPAHHAAFAFVPVTADSAPLGVLTFCYDRERTFAPAQRAFKQLVARQCALALVRVRLLGAERQARCEAEEATRAREEILSIVSHDLRNPLASIALDVSVLCHDDSEHVRRHAARLQRQADRMARLVDDLVDFAGIQAGRITLDRRRHPAATILSALGELFEPLARERGLAFMVCTAPELPLIDCDAERAVQALANLTANAIKVTPAGGTIEVGATLRDERVVFFVRDTGPGIAPADMPNLFQRHWRSKAPSYKGAGLGLSIARGIVDAHGGRIWADSALGAGSTFWLWL